jgi:hypothetical protein
VGFFFQRNKKTKNDHDEEENSCQEENSRQKRFQVQEDFPKTVQS